ncbi:MAG: type II secretion system F family protein [Sedimentisphaerales bacterium]|nr:type II secretion system F family protein [Sedimentisphaerales bacterium]
MITFKYVARNPSGEIIEGLTSAASETDILSWLREQGCTPVTVEVVTIGARKKLHVPFFQRVTSGELAAVFWQMTTMIEGGITMVEAIEAIAEDIDNARLQKILMQLLEHVERGGQISEAMAEFPEVFNKLVCALILAGETGGNIAEAFKRVAEYYTSRDRLARKVKKAIAYPAFVFGFVILIVIIIMTLIIPRFIEIFDQFGAGQLPAFTQAFMGVYYIFYNHWYIIIGVLIGAIFIFYFLLTKSESFQALWSRFSLRIPLFGKLINYAFVASFCKTSSNLLRGGVPVLEVFEILSEMNANHVIRNALNRTRESIIAGTSIFLSMATTKFYPNMLLKMVRAGEDSGALWKTLDKTSDYYEDKVDAQIATMTNLLEPFMIILVGAIVLVVVLALYLPIFSMSDIQSGSAGGGI